MAYLQEIAGRSVRHEVVWPALAALIAIVLVVGIGVTTLAAPPAGAGVVDLGFALAPCVVWALTSVVIGRFVRAGLLRQGLALSPASALLIGGGLVITGAFCVLPYEFMLTDLAGLRFDVVVPLWAFGALLLVAALTAHLLARGAGVSRSTYDDDVRP